MATVIQNGKNLPLNQSSGTMPDLSGAILNWFQPMTFGVVTKTVVNFQVRETKVDVTFQGVWQPMKPQSIRMKPEGQRSWKWFTVHALPSLQLTPDEVITYLGVQYRVADKLDYKLDGFVEYHLCQDYTGSGPTNAA